MVARRRLFVRKAPLVEAAAFSRVSTLWISEGKSKTRRRWSTADGDRMTKLPRRWAMKRRDNDPFFSC
ncbi:unnamed protein product, partial [Mesorhabditis spiculigera]